jgi:hypothetical protein
LQWSASGTAHEDESLGDHKPHSIYEHTQEEDSIDLDNTEEQIALRAEINK